MQYKFNNRGSLLDNNGNIKEPGYCNAPISQYDRKDIKANAFRIKEWDTYLVCCDKYAISLTISDNSYVGIDTVFFVSFEDGYQVTKNMTQFLPLGRKHMPSSSESGNVISVGSKHRIEFYQDNGSRRLVAEIMNFDDKTSLHCDLLLTEQPQDSIVMATPMGSNSKFMYNRKTVGFKASGFVEIGDMYHEFKKEESFGVLDWGRGVLPFNSNFYQANAYGMADDKIVAFNIGYGLGDTSKATENAAFVNGKLNKLSEVRISIPKGSKGRELYLEPWTFSSDDGCFEMDFRPILNRKSYKRKIITKTVKNQVFGRYNGEITLSTGEVLEVKNMLGYASKVINRW
ncbi:MAG: DUF2804 domain-containing protein [Lachnospiraceae bacterium]|nr:DUF2804 domain-containing protein [Lachnospiraceae bacterium]